MKRSVFFSLIFMLVCRFLWGDSSWKAGDWIEVKDAVPLMNIPMNEVFADEAALLAHLDSQKLLRSMEMVLLPGQQVQFVKRGKDFSIQVVFPSYSDAPFYTDARAFFAEGRKRPRPTRPKYISADTITQRLLSRVGVPYFWGGNLFLGEPKMLEWYSKYPHDGYLFAIWQCEGVDCSGLLYEVTEGATPRNTAGLKSFGEEVSYEGMTFEDLCKALQPLDLLVFSRHVVIVLEGGHYIESTTGGDGVVRVVDSFEAIRPFFAQKTLCVRRGLQKGIVVYQ